MDNLIYTHKYTYIEDRIVAILFFLFRVWVMFVFAFVSSLFVSISGQCREFRKTRMRLMVITKV